MMYALTNTQGTSMAEAILCGDCHHSSYRRHMVRLFAEKASDWDGGGFADATENTACECTVCGAA